MTKARFRLKNGKLWNNTPRRGQTPKLAKRFKSN
jgi:hypothetical protein